MIDYNKEYIDHFNYKKFKTTKPQNLVNNLNDIDPVKCNVWKLGVVILMIAKKVLEETNQECTECTDAPITHEKYNKIIKFGILNIIASHN
jgi:hypothetical protein